MPSWVAVGVVAAVGMTALNYVGVRPAAVFQTVAVLFLLAVGLAPVVGSFVGGDTENTQPLFNGGAACLITVLVATPFLFVGFDVIPQSAQEIHMSHRRIGQLLLISVAMTVGWYSERSPWSHPSSDGRPWCGWSTPAGSASPSPTSWWR